MKRFLKFARRASFGLWLLVFIGWLAAGCASTKQYTFSPLPVDHFETESAGPTTDPAMVGDMVIVKFADTSVTIPTHEERIKEDGIITLPLIGVIKVNGKTAHELETEISNHYVPEYYKRLSIAVTIGRGFYFVSGQVRRPGRQVYVGATTVTKAIEGAGGFTELSARWAVELVRSDGKRFRINCRKASKEPSLDLPVYPGDKINVPLTTPPDVMRWLEP